MYVLKTNLNKIIAEKQIYIDSNGIKYPANYPKEQIAELEKVKETEAPTDKIIEGFFIDENFQQVWNVRDKTQAELDTELRMQAVSLLDKSDKVATRCFKAGIPFPDEWKTYVTRLRDVVSGASNIIPDMPEYPEGS